MAQAAHTSLPGEMAALLPFASHRLPKASVFSGRSEFVEVPFLDSIVGGAALPADLFLAPRKGPGTFLEPPHTLWRVLPSSAWVDVVSG